MTNNFKTPKGGAEMTDTYAEGTCRIWLAGGFLAILAATAGASGQAPGQTADAIFSGGPIVTVNTAACCGGFR